MWKVTLKTSLRLCTDEPCARVCVRVCVCGCSRLSRREWEERKVLQSNPGRRVKPLLYGLPSLSPQKTVKPSHRGESADVMREAATRPQRNDRRTDRPQPASLRPGLGCFQRRDDSTQGRQWTSTQITPCVVVVIIFNRGSFHPQPPLFKCLCLFLHDCCFGKRAAAPAPATPTRCEVRPSHCSKHSRTLLKRHPDKNTHSN